MTNTLQRTSLKEAFDFHVGQTVFMLVPSSGDDHNGEYHEIPVGAEATIDGIEHYTNGQGTVFHLVISTGKRDDNNEELFIINSFDELDGLPRDFFSEKD